MRTKKNIEIFIKNKKENIYLYRGTERDAKPLVGTKYLSMKPIIPLMGKLPKGEALRM